MLDVGLGVIMIGIIITITMIVIKAAEQQIVPSARTANAGKATKRKAETSCFALL